MINTKKALLATALMTALCAATAFAAEEAPAKEQFKALLHKHHAQMQELDAKHQAEKKELRHQHFAEMNKLHGETCKEEGCSDLRIHMKNHKKEFKAQFEKHRKEMKAEIEQHRKEMRETFGKDCPFEKRFKELKKNGFHHPGQHHQEHKEPAAQ